MLPITFTVLSVQYQDPKRDLPVLFEKDLFAVHEVLHNSKVILSVNYVIRTSSCQGAVKKRFHKH